MISHDQATITDPKAEACLAVEKLRTEWEALEIPASSMPPEPKPDDYDRKDYKQVCMYGDVAALKELIAEGVDIQTDSNMALRQMSRYGYIKMVEFLLDQGADIHANQDFPVQSAASNGQTEMVRFLVERGADIQKSNNLALHWAAKNGQFKTVDFLLELGAPLSRLSFEERVGYDVYQQKQDFAAQIILQANETLSGIFKAATWAGHVLEMVKLWGQVPEPLQAEVDFQHILAEANIHANRQYKPRIRLVR